jgi:DNA repair protein RadC
MRADFMELGKEYGLGTAKTAQLKAALEIGRRLSLTQLDEKYQIKSPADAANLVIMDFVHYELQVTATRHAVLHCYSPTHVLV